MKPSRIALKAAGGRTKDGRSLPPKSIYVIGVDTSHGPTHELYSTDAVELVRSGAYDQLWVKNIRELGVLQPVRVRLEDVGADDTAWPAELRGTMVHVCVVGRHRVLTARKVSSDLLAEGVIADREQWQIDVVLDTRAGKAVDTVIAENRFRRSLSPLEVGTHVIQGLAAGFTEESLAEALGYSAARLRDFKALAELGVEELHRALRDKRIRASEACKVARLPAKEQRAVVKALPAQGTAKGSKVAELVADAKGESAPVRPPTRTAIVRAAQRVSDGSQGGATWTAREREVLEVAAGLRLLAEASEEIRALFAK